MALEAGSVSVANNGTITGGGLARAIMDQVLVPMNGASNVSALQQNAPFANNLAAAIVNYLVANAEVSVTIPTSASGLQRTPSPNDPNTNTQGPGTTKTLGGTLA